MIEFGDAYYCDLRRTLYVYGWEFHSERRILVKVTIGRPKEVCECLGAGAFVSDRVAKMDPALVLPSESIAAGACLFSFQYSTWSAQRKDFRPRCTKEGSLHKSPYLVLLSLHHHHHHHYHLQQTWTPASTSLSTTPTTSASPSPPSPASLPVHSPLPPSPTAPQRAHH